MEDDSCDFLRHKYKLILQYTGFGSHRTRGRESNIHYHLWEGFALDWAIHNNCSKLWGFCFTSTTDYYGLRFILTYEGPDSVFLRMHIRLILWVMDLYHRGAAYLISPDYSSRLGLYLCFNEITWFYLKKIIHICKLYPPTSGTMKPENMHGYNASRVRSEFTTETTTNFLLTWRWVT